MRIHNLYVDAAGESHFRDEVILVEDVTGKERLSKALSGQVRRSMFIPID